MNKTQWKVLKSALAAKLKRRLGGQSDPYLPLPPGTALSPSLGSAAATAKAPRHLGCDKIGEQSGEDWQALARAKLFDLSGYQSLRDKPVITHEEKPQSIGDGLLRHSFYLRIRPETDLPVHLIYKADNKQPLPVFMHLAGSTSGVHLAWGDTRVPIDHERLARGADMARQAALKGYLGVAVEQAGYGERLERKLWQTSPNRTIDLANHLLLIGRSLMGDGASDLSSAIDWLIDGAGPIAVQPDRLFLFGHSAGGTLAQYCASHDTRISGVMASGSVGPMHETIAARGAGGGDGILPGFLNWFDTADLAALVAPRPYVGLSGTRDHIFPFAGVERVVTEARSVYEKFQASDKIQAVSVDGKHGYYGPESWQAWQSFIDPPKGP